MKKYIYSALALAVTMLTACTGDYTDWASPIHNDQPATVSFGDGSVTEVSLIDYANIPADQSQVQVCKMVAPTATDASYSTKTYLLTLMNGESSEQVALAEDGSMSAEDLKSFVELQFGKAPTERTMTAYVEQWISNGSTSIKTVTSENFNVKVKLSAPHISTGYYLVGDMTGWDQTAAEANPFKRASGTTEDELYADPYFTITFTTTADNQYWKIIPQENVDASNIWADGVVGTVADGETAMTGTLTNNGANAGKIEKAGKYKMTIDMMNYTYTIEEVKYNPYVYFIGSTDGWAASDQKLALTDEDNGIYTGYVYVADPNGWGFAGKFQREAGSWDNQINAGTFTGGMEGVSGSDNIEFSEESVYYIEMNLTELTLKATKVTTMGIIGDFNSWGGDVEMTWNATDYCFEVTNPGVTASGWKFRLNSGWDVNLGGSLSNLIANGDNLSAVGNTIKLYPCRKGTDNIYCTVE